MRTSAWGQSRREPLLIDLGLQGGGAHGAFTWGVLDRLLEEPWLRIDGISRTSAGAMNAAVLVHDFVQNGAPGARAALEEGERYPGPASSARSSAPRSTSCSAAGRLIIRLCSRRLT